MEVLRQLRHLAPNHQAAPTWVKMLILNVVAKFCGMCMFSGNHAVICWPWNPSLSNPFERRCLFTVGVFGGIL